MQLAVYNTTKFRSATVRKWMLSIGISNTCNLSQDSDYALSLFDFDLPDSCDLFFHTAPCQIHNLPEVLAPARRRRRNLQIMSTSIGPLLDSRMVHLLVQKGHN